ncbi:MAG TPA: peptidase M23, partial [Candidatus Enterocloster faecavium]|nr:peptidase M23 [Candidatus Enterocloster faecavium]
MREAGIYQDIRKKRSRKGRKTRWREMAAALAVCLGAGSFLAYGEVGSQEMEEAQGKVSVLEEEMAKTEETLKELEALKADTAAYVRSLDANLNELNGQLTALSEDIDAKEEEIRQAGLELEAAKEKESSQYESMKLRIKYMYEAGDTAFLDLILQSESVEQLLNRTEYVNQITKYDRDMLEQYRQIKGQVAAQEQALEEEHGELLSLQEETEAKQNSVEQLMADKQAELASYNSQIASAQADLEEYQADLEAQ